MPKLYPITEEEWPATGTREVFYEVATGRILDDSGEHGNKDGENKLTLALGEKAMIASGKYATKTIILPGFQLAELSKRNIKLGIGGNPTLIGPKTYTNVKPV